MSGPAAPRVVLDTNVCLDLFVFRSERSAPLRTLLECRQLQAVTRDDCRAEWHRVLRYPALAAVVADAAPFVTMYDAMLIDLQAIAMRATRVPRCRDPDDQKFLELARDAGAIALVTRDAELLTLARRARKAGLFDILEPAEIGRIAPRAVASPACG